MVPPERVCAAPRAGDLDTEARLRRLALLRSVEGLLHQSSWPRAKPPTLRFAPLLDGTERRHLRTLFPELVGGSAPAWEACARAYLRRVLRFDHLARCLRLESVDAIDRWNPASVVALTRSGSLLLLSPGDQDGRRAYHHEPMPGVRRSPKTGFATLHQSLAVGHRAEVDDLRVSEITALAAKPVEPAPPRKGRAWREERSLVVDALPAPDVSAALLDYATRINSLRGPLAPSARSVEECEALACALFVQETLGGGVPLENVAAFATVEGTEYFVSGRLAPTISRLGANGQRTFSHVTIAPQRAVIGAPLVLFGSTNARRPTTPVCFTSPLARLDLR